MFGRPKADKKKIMIIKIIKYSLVLLPLCLTYCNDSTPKKQTEAGTSFVKAASLAAGIPDIKAFKKKSALEQNKYFASLSEADKFIFLKAYLPGESYLIPPHDAVFFFCTGDMIFANTDIEKVGTFKWEVRQQSLVISGPKPGIIDGDIDTDIRRTWIKPQGRPNLDRNFSFSLKNANDIEDSLFLTKHTSFLLDIEEKLGEFVKEKVAACQ